MSESNEVAIYSLSDPRTGLVHYVGASVQPKIRKRFHMRPTRDSCTYEWVSTLSSFGLSPVFAIIETCSLQSWAAREAHWISTLRVNSHPLLNKLPGGNGRISTANICGLDFVTVTIEMKRALHKRLKHLATDQDTTITALLTQCAERLAPVSQPDRTTEQHTPYTVNPSREAEEG